MSAKRAKRVAKKDKLCSNCHIELKTNQLYCFECGEPTSVLKEELSAIKNLKAVWSNYQETKGQFYSFSIFYIFIVLLPIALIVALTHNSYYLNNILLLLYLPLAFIPLGIRYNGEGEVYTIKSYITNLKLYPRLFLFTALNIVYFFILKHVASGVDPILNLVRLVMVLYWLAIVVPLPLYMIRINADPFKSLLIVYKAGKEPRWQLFFTYFLLFLLNLGGLVLIGLGLLITIPFSFAVIERYYLQMEKYGLFVNPTGKRENVS